MEYAIMDDRGIIEDFKSLTQALMDIVRVRKETEDIKGDLKIIEIHATSN
jgi:hypothetical protein